MIEGDSSIVVVTYSKPIVRIPHLSVMFPIQAGARVTLLVMFPDQAD